jgi:hypothetical protein
VSGERVVAQDLGPWVVEMEWPPGVDHGGPGYLVVRPADPESYPHGGVSQTLLRQIDFKAAADDLRRQHAVSDRRRRTHEAHEADRDERIRTALTEGVTDEYLALLASKYVSVTNQGQAKPLRVLAELTGKSESTMKVHLWHARKRGLLEGSAGRAGGKLTPKASGILAKIVPGAENLRPLIDG